MFLTSAPVYLCPKRGAFSHISFPALFSSLSLSVCVCVPLLLNLCKASLYHRSQTPSDRSFYLAGRPAVYPSSVFAPLHFALARLAPRIPLCSSVNLRLSPPPYSAVVNPTLFFYACIFRKPLIVPPPPISHFTHFRLCLFVVHMLAQRRLLRGRARAYFLTPPWHSSIESNLRTRNRIPSTHLLSILRFQLTYARICSSSAPTVLIDIISSCPLHYKTIFTHSFSFSSLYHVRIICPPSVLSFGAARGLLFLFLHLCTY